MPPIWRERSESSSIAVATSRDEPATPRIASVAWAAAATPSPATRRASFAASVVVWALSALSSAALAASWIACRVDSTMRTWRSAPCATSLTAAAISPTALPVSSDVAAICCEVLLSAPALRATSPTSSRRLATISANAVPRPSWSDFGVTVAVRSPAAI